MSTVLGANNYGKAEVRLVRLVRGDTHELVDLNVSVALAGDLAQTHLTGDNANVLPTDSQKNTVYAFARRYGVTPVEEFGLRLARHFVQSLAPIALSRVELSAYPWRRLGPHSFARTGEGVRTAAVTCDGAKAYVVAGVSDLVLLNSTGSAFAGFPRDEYTTLAETGDRILATAVEAAWRYRDDEGPWDAWYDAARAALLDAFRRPSDSLQQTLYAMGGAVIEAVPAVAEIRLSLPNRHHFLVDLAPFGLENPGEVFFAADRPYGLIEGTVRRDGAEVAPLAWSLPR
jgi:urate oxidase